MLCINIVRQLQQPCQNVRGMCQLIKLPTQRLKTKKSLADLEAGEDDFDKRPSPVADIEARIEASKAKLRWRKAPVEQTHVWFSKLRHFAPERTNMDSIMRGSRAVFDPHEYIKHNRQLQLSANAFLQSYIVERHQLLGNDLATAHFLVHRGGSVKFANSQKWIKRDEMHEYRLPTLYDPVFHVEELNCDNMTIHYEGLENIRRLKSLKKISMQNVRTLDDWAMDRLAGNDFPQLETLNISGSNVTANGLIALYKLPSLRLLIVDNPKRSSQFELTLLTIQDAMKNLVVRDSVTGEEF